ncbi:MAG: HupE/UreJ family protein [Proteobacteria bacterium]|nr:HupE/UreJ family protein [Pseudomonadota bacterium]
MFPRHISTPRRLIALVFLVAGVTTVAARVVAAHELRPAIASMTFAGDGRYALSIAANMEALVAGISDKHADTNDAPNAARYDQLRALPPAELTALIERFVPRWLDGIRVEFDGERARPQLVEVVVPSVGDLGLARISQVRFSGAVASGAKTLQWQYDAAFGSSVIRVERKDAGAGEDAIVASWLKDGAKSAAIALAGASKKSFIDTFATYTTLGFTHILPGGLDHILFVLGLYLLSTQWKPLLVQVTAFTVAHSMTLGLGLYGVVQVSPVIVEPLIAASIVYVAVENVITNKLNAWRPFVVFGFGLLHGLGFAGVLHEIGLPRADYVTGLVAFNIGVELGQLSVITLAFLATGLWFRSRPWYRGVVVVPASMLIAAIGAFWTVQRIFLV